MADATDWQQRLENAAPGLVERSVLVGERPRSVILRGLSPEFGEVCVKYDPRPGGLARMEAEYRGLRSYHAAAGEAGPFGAPRPCTLVRDPEGGAALVMSWIGCPRADDRLGRTLPFASVRAQVLRRAAGWLAHFHRLGRAEKATLGSALDLASLEAQLRAVLCAEPGVRGRDPALAALAEAIGASAGAPVRVTTLHGDFLPQNLFLCGERTIGIDFTMDVVGPALRDVGTFLANVLWRGYSTFDPGRSARFERDVEIFLEAYHDGPAARERAVAHLFVLAELGRKAQALSAKIRTRRFGTSDRAHRLMIVGAIRRLLRRDPETSTPPA